MYEKRGLLILFLIAFSTLMFASILVIYRFPKFGIGGMGSLQGMVSLGIEGASIPPWFTNLKENQSYAFAGQYINFSATANDDILVDSAWLSHNFDIFYKEDQSSALSNGGDVNFGSSRYAGQSFRFLSYRYLYSICWYGIKSNAGHFTGDAYISIYSTSGGVPRDYLGNITISSSSISTTAALRCFNLTRPIYISPMVTYAVVFSSPASTSASAYAVSISKSNTPGGITTGTAMYSTNNGATWTTYTNSGILCCSQLSYG